MDKYKALNVMLSLFVVEIGTQTTFNVPYMIQAMERELKYRRAFPASCSVAWMTEFTNNYRLAKAVNKAFPNLSSMHPEPVNICYWRRA